MKVSNRQPEPEILKTYNFYGVDVDKCVDLKSIEQAEEYYKNHIILSKNMLYV